MAQRFKEGQRVRLLAYDIYTHIPEGATGTTALIAGFKGKSVYPDPQKLMVFVKWDKYGEQSVWRKSLERIKGK